MKCPYCNEEMTKGDIYGDRYPLKWLPRNKKLLFGLWAAGGVRLGEGGGGFGVRPRVEARLCSACKKIVIDLNESDG